MGTLKDTKQNVPQHGKNETAKFSISHADDRACPALVAGKHLEIAHLAWAEALLY